MHRQPVASYYQHAYPPQTAHQGQYHDPAALVSLGYRPLQLPFQQQHQQSVAEQQQLSLAAAGFHNPSFRPHHQQALPLRTRQQTRRQAQAMAYAQQSEEDLAELQKMSNEYEPEVTVSDALTFLPHAIRVAGEIVKR